MRRSQDEIDASRRENALRLVWTRLKEHPLARLGPGLITGVADDDPSGIATYSQAGAQFGLNMLWTMPLAFPLMSAIQSMCGFIGRVTGKGLAANIKATFPRSVLQGVMTPPWLMPGGLGLAVLLALLVGTPPALRAMRLNVVDALMEKR